MPPEASPGAMGGPAGRVIEDAWALLDPATRPLPLPSPPVLVILVGVPLSGKSTLARALAREATTALALVENDALRARLAHAMGRPHPLYDQPENFLTYRIAGVLVEAALDVGASAVHDATNLAGADRRRLAAAARERGAEVALVHLQTAPDVIAQRFDAVDETRREAHRKLGAKRPQPSADLPHLVIDGAAPVEETLARLREWAPTRPLFA